MAGQEDIDRVILMIAKIHMKDGGLVQTKSTHECLPKTMWSSDTPIPPHLMYLPTHTFTSSNTTAALVCGVVITLEGLLTKLGTQLHMGGTFLFFLAFDWLQVGFVSLFWFLCGAGDVTMLQLTMKGRPFLMFLLTFSGDAMSVNSYKADESMNYDEDVSRSPHPMISSGQPSNSPSTNSLTSAMKRHPSMSSALDTNTMVNAVGDSDITMQDLTGDPSSPIPKAGATPTLSPTTTSTTNANTYRHDQSQRHH
ncbi:hypothetical protein EDC04DRAFT_2837395 [Pisolithus marmoratus]|nr:hypothetical protein EDC04DRAFT_2837395 [Pisolithus marmoratus]